MSHNIPQHILDAMYKKHIAAVGQTGTGKTFATKAVVVEPLIRAKKRVVVLDPTGAWWGLRSGPDGKSPGLPVTIFGGKYADVPITEHAGTALGSLVAKSDVQAIIDLSDTTLSARRRFVADFAEEVFRLNEEPLYLVIDEADEFAPQNGPPGTERMLGAIDRIVRRGRIKGFRVVMISQRPAVLNKNILSQAATLITLGLKASQDRKALQDWVKGQADESQARDMLTSLSSLKMGEGWVWCSSENYLDRVKFPQITTFDSSKTPEDGKAIKATLMPLGNLDAVSAQLAASIEEVKANDPSELKKQIKDLKKQLNDERCKPIDIHAGDVGRLQEQILSMQNAWKAERESAAVWFKRSEYLACQIEKANAILSGACQGAIYAHPGPKTIPDSPREAPESRAAQAPEQPPTKGLAERPAPAVAPPQHRAVAGNTRSLEKGPGLILDAVAWWFSLGIKAPTRAQVAAVAGYAVSGGSFQKYVSTLSSAKLIQLSPGCMSITDEGRELAAWPDATPTRRSLHERVLGILDGGPRKILAVLLQHDGEAMGRTQLGELSGYEATGGSFQKYLSTLSSLGLVTYPKRTTPAAAAWLFDSWLRESRAA